ncbi:MAG: hypothetical protein RIT25_93 [Planctomycetota bacterium]
MHPIDPVLPPWVVFHLPHASTHVPAAVRQQLLVDAPQLANELEVLTDHHVLELFLDAACSAPHVRATASRLVVDVERFPEDDEEPAARHGFGAIQTRTTTGARLRSNPGSRQRARLLRRHAAHHERLAAVIDAVLQEHGRCLVVDCHSFPDQPIPFEQQDGADTSRRRPDICIGTDAFHTSEVLAGSFEQAFTAAGFEVARNWPYAGALVPKPFHQRDPRVAAVMVEVNRRACRDASGPVASHDHPVARRVRACVAAAAVRFAQQAAAPAEVAVGAPAGFVREALTVFEVHDGERIEVPGEVRPNSRAYHYEWQVDGWEKSASALAAVAASFEPMIFCLKRIYGAGLDEDCDLPAEPYIGIPQWLRAIDEKAFRREVVPHVEAWLDEEPGSGEEDHCEPSTAQGGALRFFDAEDNEVLDILQVKVVEGEHPGSTYHAAELRCSIDAANAAAHDHGIAIRFVPGEVVVGRRATRLEEDAIDAWRELHYVLRGPQPLTLRIGTECRALAPLYVRWGVDSCTFVTAGNPEGKPLDGTTNAARHAALRSELEHRRIPFLESAGGTGDDGKPQEPGLFVFGLGLDEARALGTKWEQHALVWAGADAVARLVLLR